MEKKENLEVMVGVMQGSIDAIQSSLGEIKKAISDLRIDIVSNYVTKNELRLEIKGLLDSRELELKNIRDSFEPTKKRVDDVISQIMKYVVGIGLGILVADKFIPKF